MQTLTDLPARLGESGVCLIAEALLEILPRSAEALRRSKATQVSRHDLVDCGNHVVRETVKRTVGLDEEGSSDKDKTHIEERKTL